jgi:type II secretion system protein H
MIASHGTAGFTLIELMLVMAMLLIVWGLAFPSLRGFFRGRTIDSEARRFLSLTLYAQSRAVTEGLPMVLWIDPQQRRYGLQVQAGYLETDTKAVDYGLAENLELETRKPQQRPLTASQPPKAAGIGSVPMIRFLPDGTIGDTSPNRITIRQGRDADAPTISIVQHTNRLNYAIHTDTNDSRQR